jgi:hypothetical protein
MDWTIPYQCESPSSNFESTSVLVLSEQNLPPLNLLQPSLFLKTTKPFGDNCPSTYTLYYNNPLSRTFTAILGLFYPVSALPIVCANQLCRIFLGLKLISSVIVDKNRPPIANLFTAHVPRCSSLSGLLYLSLERTEDLLALVQYYTLSLQEIFSRVHAAAGPIFGGLSPTRFPSFCLKETPILPLLLRPLSFHHVYKRDSPTLQPNGHRPRWYRYGS